jgi:hypothetical protein
MAKKYERVKSLVTQQSRKDVKQKVTGSSVPFLSPLKDARLELDGI